jgi:hypothetical protein
MIILNYQILITIQLNLTPSVVGISSTSFGEFGSDQSQRLMHIEVLP